MEYLTAKYLPELINLLQFWKSNAVMFPNVSAMARDVLAIPGTSTAFERKFSSAKHTISDSRTCLNPETVQAFLCLKDWL